MTRRPAFVVFCLAILIAGPFASGCDLLGIGGDGVRLETDEDSYTVKPSTLVVLTVKNNFRAPVYYICTGQIYLDEMEGGDVVDSWQVHGFEECGFRVPIESGESETFEISFEESLASDLLESAKFDETVRYRLRFDLFETDDVDQLLDKNDRVSNIFKILL